MPDAIPKRPLIMRTPTHQQRRLLRYLAAGLTLGAPAHGSTQYRLLLEGKLAAYVQARTVAALLEAGWIEERASGLWKLTDSGRAHAEVHTFVRAFAEEAAS